MIQNKYFHTASSTEIQACGDGSSSLLAITWAACLRSRNLTENLKPYSHMVLGFVSLKERDRQPTGLTWAHVPLQPEKVIESINARIITKWSDLAEIAE
jgi:hypothetical protein